MKKTNMLLFALLSLIFIGFVIQSLKISESIMIREPPHFMRRLGLSPPNCPFRDQYY
jgi:hypothetical protein